MLTNPSVIIIPNSAPTTNHTTAAVIRFAQIHPRPHFCHPDAHCLDERANHDANVPVGGWVVLALAGLGDGFDISCGD